MKRRIVACILVGVMSLSLFACGTEEVAESEEISTVSMTSDEETPYQSQIITKEQMLSDYDAMWEVMEESYPFWGVLSRSNPGDPLYYTAVIDEYRKQIQEMDLDGDEAMFEFFMIIAYSLYDVCGTVGHVSIVNSDYFRALDVYKRYVDEMPEVEPWVDVIERTEVIDLYEYYDYLIEFLAGTDESQEDEGEVDEIEEEPEEIEQKAVNNLTMEILEEGRTAYIEVLSFNDELMEGDLPKIRAFLEEIRDYEHLIIDIENNGGGNTLYWEEAFVRPNLSESASSRLVRLMKDTELSRRFYGEDYKLSAQEIEEIIRDPKFTALPEEDMEGLTLARVLSDITEPEFEEKLYQGDIWVLVGPAVYSSAEAFAVFCKDTGFATLVGETTGGSDSGGPILFELPDSHLLVQFDVEYCLNADGSCNQETGTAPDIEAEDALQAVLDRINAQ